MLIISPFDEDTRTRIVWFLVTAFLINYVYFVVYNKEVYKRIIFYYALVSLILITIYIAGGFRFLKEAQSDIIIQQEPIKIVKPPNIR